MRFSRRRVVVVIGSAFTVPCCMETPGPVIDPVALRAHSYFLSHDALAGRAAGSEGERGAAAYIVSRLLAAGVEGGGRHGGFLQPVPLQTYHFDSARTQLVVTGAGVSRTFRAPHFYHVGGAERAFRDFSGDVLFLGPMSGALSRIDSVPDVRGRVVVTTISPGDRGPFLAELTRRGAAGLLVGIERTALYQRLHAARGPVRYALRIPIDDPYNQPRIPVLGVDANVLQALGIDAAATGSAAGAAAAAPRTVRVTLAATARRVEGENVLGLVRGSDPSRRDELVIYLAHYDHVGVGLPVDGDSIYNGFVDNAAGVSALLEIAKTMRAEPPARSVLFLFSTAEEQGSLGASAFLADTAFAVDRIAAVINMDAGAPPRPARHFVIAGGDASTVGETAERVAKENGWRAESAPAIPDSDHWPFVLRRVPAVFVLPSGEWEGVASQEEGNRLFEALQHPHQPSDEWRADYPFAGLQRYAEFTLRLGSALAGAAERPAPLERP